MIKGYSDQFHGAFHVHGYKVFFMDWLNVSLSIERAQGFSLHYFSTFILRNGKKKLNTRNQINKIKWIAWLFVKFFGNVIITSIWYTSIKRGFFLGGRAGYKRNLLQSAISNHVWKDNLQLALQFSLSRVLAILCCF